MNGSILVIVVWNDCNCHYCLRMAQDATANLVARGNALTGIQIKQTSFSANVIVHHFLPSQGVAINSLPIFATIPQASGDTISPSRYDFVLPLKRPLYLFKILLCINIFPIESLYSLIGKQCDKGVRGQF